jgi:hypothetical protein
VGAAARGPGQPAAAPGGDRVPAPGRGPAHLLAGPPARRGLALPEHPGFDEHLWISTEAATLYLLFLGRISLSAAMDDSTVRVDGPPSLVRALPGWFRLRP